MRNNTLIYFLLVLLVLPGSRVGAQEPAAGSGPRLGVSLTLPEKTAPARVISLDEASRLALANCLDIQIAKYDTYIKQQDLAQAESIFDTFLTMEASYLKDKKRPSISLLDTRKTENAYSLAVTKKLPSGSTLALSAGDSRTDASSALSPVNPYHQSLVGVSLTQPLGKNFFGLSDRAGIEVTKLDIESVEYTSLAAIEQILYQVQLAYWDLALKVEQLAIRRERLHQARRLRRAYDDKYDIGTAEETALLAMQANERIREKEVLAASLAQEQAKNELLFLLNEEDLSCDLRPADPLELVAVRANLASALQRAVANRRDYARLRNRLTAAGIEIQVKENALWPEIDLTASFSRNGLSRKFKQAASQTSSQNYSELFFGLEVSFPLENTQARSDLEKSRLIKEQLLLALKRLERFIFKEVANQIKEVNSLKDQLEFSVQIRKLQADKLAEELQALNYGRSSSDLIIRYEDDLLASQLQEAQTLFYYRAALLGLELAENSLLNKYWKDQL